MYGFMQAHSIYYASFIMHHLNCNCIGDEGSCQNKSKIVTKGVAFNLQEEGSKNLWVAATV